MSDSDVPESKKTGKPLSQKRQLRRLLSHLLDEEGVSPNNRLSQGERKWMEDLLRNVDREGGEARAGDFLGQLQKGLRGSSRLEDRSSQGAAKPASEREHLRDFLEWMMEGAAPPEVKAEFEQSLRDIENSRISESEARKHMENLREALPGEDWMKKAMKKPSGPYRVK